MIDLQSIIFYTSSAVVVLFGVVFVVANVFSSKKMKIDKNTHVVITGGSSGIGLALAKEYVSRGASVTIVARNPEMLATASGELRALVSSIHNDQPNEQIIRTVSVDCASSENKIKLAFDASSVPNCDILVNCAGVSIAGAFDDLPIEEFERMMRINLLGSVYPTRVLLPCMKQRGKGIIVFVSSQVAQVAIHGYSAYAASKWAVRGLAEALAMEVKPWGISVSVAYPPDTDTPGYKEEMKTKPSLTSKLSSAGIVFTSQAVAKDIIEYSNMGYFGISTGLDGWLLKQLHPGMTPISNLWEVLQQIAFSGLSRLIAVFYIASFDQMCQVEKDNESSWRAVEGDAGTSEKKGSDRSSPSKEEGTKK